MTLITIDTETIGSAIAGLGTGAVALYGWLKTRGYWDTWKTKLLVPAPIAEVVKESDNDKALEKLQMSDDLLEFLRELAPNDDGTINEEKAIDSLRDCIKWNNRILPIKNLHPEGKRR
jgi:hypothetical protein